VDAVRDLPAKKIARLAVAVAVSAAASLFVGGNLAAAKTSATDPCHGLSASLTSRCQKAYVACSTAPPSVRQQCLTALDNAFNAIRAAGSKGAGAGTTTGKPKTAPGSTAAATTPSQTSPPPPPPPAAAAPAAGAPPPPTKGVSADATPVTGTVLVNGKPLVAGERIPIGATVDATNGTVTLESVSTTGTLQRANFAGATFKLGQPASGITTLTLKGGNFNVCSTKGTRQLGSAVATPTVVRSLWGNGHGDFTTTGRYAAATVRGTVWETQDRCDGTRIFVKQDTVTVFDLVRKKTITLRSGQSYLAKP
jgi:hypothetical protein